MQITCFTDFTIPKALKRTPWERTQIPTPFLTLVCTAICDIPRIYHAFPYPETPTNSKPTPLTRPIHRPPHIPTPQQAKKHHHLEKKPLPAPRLLLPVELFRLPPLLPRATIRRRRSPWLTIPLVDVFIARGDGDDIVIIAQLARFGREAQVGDGGEGEGPRFEAFGPLVFGFVEEVDFEGFLLEVG